MQISPSFQEKKRKHDGLEGRVDGGGGRRGLVKIALQYPRGCRCMGEKKRKEREWGGGETLAKYTYCFSKFRMTSLYNHYARQRRERHKQVVLRHSNQEKKEKINF